MVKIQKKRVCSAHAPWIFVQKTAGMNCTGDRRNDRLEDCGSDGVYLKKGFFVMPECCQAIDCLFTINLRKQGIPSLAGLNKKALAAQLIHLVANQVAAIERCYP
jgi:hypothetical protein